MPYRLPGQHGNAPAKLHSYARGSTGSSEIRILFVFDPIRRAVLLVAGDKSSNWRGWYKTAIPLADDRYETHLAELETRNYQ